MIGDLDEVLSLFVASYDHAAIVRMLPSGHFSFEEAFG